MNRLTAVLTVAVCGVALAADNPWGRDINTGAGPALIDSVRGDLAEIVAAGDGERAALIGDFVSARGDATIEAVKRFRNPELLPLFHSLLARDDWRVKHRALTALEHYRDTSAIADAWPLLRHEERRMREKAAIAILTLWDARAAKDASGGDPAAALERLRDLETDPHVAACLDALLLRAKGKLDVREAHVEHVETLPDGLMLTPFINGMPEAKAKAPGYTAKPSSQAGGGSAAKLDPTRPWTTPLIAMGEEVVSGTSLQPFANLRQEGKVYHTGLDVGACMDGAGYYAAADGIVRFVHTGSDMGTLLVVQHHLGDKRLVNAVYMHGGGTVFVKGGAQVASGQLLGTMGMSYSIENGGHYAHLHYGLYPGEFSATHNYGYRGVPSGLVDWYDPAHYLPVWAELTRPLVVADPGGVAELRKARELVAAGKLGDAWKEAGRYDVDSDPAVEPDERADAYMARVSADALRRRLESAVRDAPDRFGRVRALGYPSRALAFLQDAAKTARGVPGADELAATAKEWAKDAGLKADIKAEALVVKAEATAMESAGTPDGARAAKAFYESLLEELGDTCVRPRLEALIEGTGVR